MSVRKWMTPSQEGVSIQEYVDTFKKEGKVSVPSPDGKGVYTIHMSCGGYYVPKLVWRSYEKDDHDRYSPAFLKSNEGREILWYPKGLGVHYANQAAEKYRTNTEYFIAMAKMVIGLILAGRQLYTLRCGANISSLNDNATQNSGY